MSILSLALAFASELIRIFSHRGVLSQLEEDKLRLQTQLHQQNTDLKNKLEEQGSTFRSQVENSALINTNKSTSTCYSSNQRIQKLVSFKEISIK